MTVTDHYGWPIPNEDSSTEIWDHIASLGEAADDSLHALATGIGNNQTYTPVWSGGGPLNIGNGSITGRYVKIGRFVFGHVHLVRGSTTNVGSGNYTFSLPTPAIAWQTAVGNGFVRLASGTFLHGLTVGGVGGGVVGLSWTMDGVRVGNSNRPGGGSWETGDEFSFSFHYISGS